MSEQNPIQEEDEAVTNGTGAGGGKTRPTKAEDGSEPSEEESDE